VLLLAVGGRRRRRWRQSRHVLRPRSHHSWLLLRLTHHSQRLLLLLRMPHSHHHLLLLLLLLHLHTLHHLLLLLCPRDKCARAGRAHLGAARGDRPLHMHHTLARPLMLLLLLAQHSLLRHLLLLLLLSRHHHTAGRHPRLPHQLLALRVRFNFSLKHIHQNLFLFRKNELRNLIHLKQNETKIIRGFIQNFTSKTKICCNSFFCSHKFHQIDHYFSFEMLKKKIRVNFQRIIGITFYPKKLSLSSQKYGFGIRDPEKTYSGSRIQGVKKAPDPGSDSATLYLTY
jgi:hypothetical protein